MSSYTEDYIRQLETRVAKPIAEVCYSGGRAYLKVAGIVVAMEGDPCRDYGNIPESVLPLPPDEIEHATIGGRRVKDLPPEIIRFFRGDKWTNDMLLFVARKINGETNEAYERGRADERGACAKVVEGWKGRRLESPDPESEVNKAFGRGVDMASHYIAADIRRRGEGNK